MDRKRILLYAVISAAVLSLLCVILPTAVETVYSSIMLPLALLLGFIFGIQVASTYQKALKMSFVFLSLFLVIYMLVNIPYIWPPMYALLKENLIFLLLAMQIVNYAMLIISCAYTLKVIEARKMNKYGWVVFGVLLALGIFVVVYGIPPMLGALPYNPAGAISGMMIRLFDISIVLMLVPVLVLYLQYSKSQAQESITFTLVMLGIIISLLSTYIIQFATGMTSLDEAAQSGFVAPSVINAAYLFGYLIIAIGLYAHRKYDDWGFQMIEKALG